MTASAQIVESSTQPGRFVWWCDICDHIGREQGGGGVEDTLLEAQAALLAHFLDKHVAQPVPKRGTAHPAGTDGSNG